MESPPTPPITGDLANITPPGKRHRLDNTVDGGTWGTGEEASGLAVGDDEHEEPARQLLTRISTARQVRMLYYSGYFEAQARAQT